MFSCSLLSQLDKIFSGMCEIFVTVLGDHQHILDPHSAEIRDVNSGFNSDDGACLDDPFLGNGESGIFMDLKTYGVTETVAEILTVSGFGAAMRRIASRYASMVGWIFFSSPRPISGMIKGGCGTTTAPTTPMMKTSLISSLITNH